MKVLFAAVVLLGGAFAAPSLRITGGEDAERDEFPYQVSMQWGLIGIWQHICGGSIISDQWIVTAAHCITETPSLGSFRIKAGLLNLNDNLASVQTITVQSRTVHANYAGGVNPNDIALLRLSSPLTWTDSVQPINLPSAGAVPTGDSLLSGWGSVSTTTIPSMPNILQKATLPLLDLNTCANALVSLFGTSNPLDSTNVCTGPLTGGISACSGDSGGPLAQNGELIGVVSWGVTPCGTNGAPSVYVQVSSFIDWINANTVSLQWGLGDIWQHICDGSTLTPTRVVTAAHCITNALPLGSFRIKAGLLYLTDYRSSVETVSVQSQIVHENYTSGLSANDIALLILTSGLSWSDSVQPINLPLAGVVPTGSAVLSGWGSISTGSTPIMPIRLQAVTLPLLNLTTCANALAALPGTLCPLDSSILCTGPLTGGIFACYGDSGGPLVQGKVLIGIVSSVIFPCGTIGAPSTYVQVSSFIDWIEANIT